MEAKKTLTSVAKRILKEVHDVVMLEAERHIPKAWQAKRAFKAWRRHHRILKAWGHYHRNGPRFVARVLRRVILRNMRRNKYVPPEIAEAAEKARLAGLAALEELRKSGRL